MHSPQRLNNKKKINWTNSPQRLNSKKQCSIGPIVHKDLIVQKHANYWTHMKYGILNNIMYCLCLYLSYKSSNNDSNVIH